MGSNIDARSNISSGIDALRQTFGQVECSAVYQTAAFGFKSDDFINLVVRIETDMSPLKLKIFLTSLEDRHGRNRQSPKFSDRTLDILVNNASRFYPTQAGRTLAWQWDDLVNSNLRGPYFLVQALLEDLRTAGGSIINILDIHADRPMPGHAVYCISKAGLAMMTQALATELGPSIRVNGVAPGAILWAENEPDAGEKQTILDRTALGRTGEPGDIASAVAYLALDAPYVTGQILAVDGGRSLNI